MTAYARESESSSWGDISWELRSVNSRFRDIHLSLPNHLRFLEPKVRDILSEDLRRGKIEANLKFQPSACQSPSMHLNQDYLKTLCAFLEPIKAHAPQAAVSAVDLLAWPGVVSQAVESPDIKDQVLRLLQKTLQTFIGQRLDEGQRIRLCLIDIIQQMKAHKLGMLDDYQGLQGELKTKLKERLTVLSAQVQQERFEQELVLFLNKMDIDEELQRFDSHIIAIFQLIESSNPIGRKLEFYLQELGREVNTIGSKLQGACISERVVNFKVSIEKMREQAQNIE